MVRFHSDSIDLMDSAPTDGDGLKFSQSSGQSSGQSSSQANQLNHWHDSDPWVTGTGFEASYMSEDPMWDIRMVLSGISIAAVLAVRTPFTDDISLGSILT